MLLDRGRNREDRERHHGRDIGLHDAERTDAVDPHHRRRRIADNAAGAAGVGGRYDRNEIADMDLPPKDVTRDRAPDQRSGDVIEKTRQHENDDEKEDAAFPVIGQHGRHFVRYPAFLEVSRQNGKPHQQQEQVRQRDPLVRHVASEPAPPCAGLESGEADFVADDGDEADKRDRKRMTMKQRDAEQNEPEENEIEGNSSNQDRIGHRALIPADFGEPSPAKRHSPTKRPYLPRANKSDSSRL